MTAKLPVAVLQAADATASNHGVDRTMVLTDVVCLHYGRRDLVRSNAQQLLFETDRAATDLTAEGRKLGPHVKVCPPRPVADVIEKEYPLLGIKRSTLLADIICRHFGFPELVRELDPAKEGLPLAM